ncbi:MAG TPA: hypothetical protein VHO90_04000 [Bacteroidales bacterium]|nr:hypothetical protein [Bacteroidales bacterium]
MDSASHDKNSNSSQNEEEKHPVIQAVKLEFRGYASPACSLSEFENDFPEEETKPSS